MTTPEHEHYHQRDHHFMQLALSAAKKAEACDEVPVGAVVVLDDQVIGEGYNQPVGAHDPTAHAEVVALRNAAQSIQNYRLPNTTLYVTLEPCTMCVGAIIHARVKRVVYAARDPKSGAVTSCCELATSDYFNHFTDFEGGLCAQESADLLRAFFKKRR